MNRRGFLARLVAAPIVALAVLRASIVDAAQAAEPEIVGVATTLQRGDMFTIAGRYAVNPMTRRSTGWLQQFIVTADVQAGDLLPTQVIYPPIRTTGIYQNVTGDAAGAVIDGRDLGLVTWGDVLWDSRTPSHSCVIESA